MEGRQQGSPNEVELLNKEKAEREEEHDTKIVEVIAKVKGSIVVAVCETKIKLAEGVAIVGSWNVSGWREALGKLTGKSVNTS